MATTTIIRKKISKVSKVNTTNATKFRPVTYTETRKTDNS